MTLAGCVDKEDASNVAKSGVNEAPDAAVSGSDGGMLGAAGNDSTGTTGDDLPTTDSTPQGNACELGDTVTLGDMVYDETKIEDNPIVCDPQIKAVYYADLDDKGPGYNLLLHYDWDTSQRTFASFAAMNVYGAVPGTYPIGKSVGNADVTLYLAGVACVAESGSIVLADIDESDGIVQGEIAIDRLSIDAACPESLLGSFRMTVVNDPSG